MVYYDDQESAYCDDQEYSQAPVYSLGVSEAVHQLQSQSKPGSRYFVTLPISATGSNFKKLSFQIDTAATCNTIAEHMLNSLVPPPVVSPSPFVLHPYGDGPQIMPSGQVDLLCERGNTFELLTFQVLPGKVMGSKPALLSGSDSEKLGLITIHSANVHAVSIQPKTSEVKASKSKEVGPPGYQTSSRSTSATPPTVAPSPGKLTKAEILKSYAAQFKGRGYLGPPVHFKLNPDVHTDASTSGTSCKEKTGMGDNTEVCTGWHFGQG
jgi:hypothetical protein